MRYLLLGTPIIFLAAMASTAYAQAPQAMPPATIAPQAPAAAAESNPTATATVKPIDALFDALKRERSPEKARGIANQIIADINDSDSPTVNLLMQWSAEAIKKKNTAAALDFLDRVTLIDPAYTEGWNRRATLHYTMGDRRKSMADIAEVLQREPRHFGALAGMAGILTEAGDDQLALKAWQRYLGVYPADRDAQEAVDKLSEKIAGNRT
jgi:tetratricopeptide (TPR) repeat protein